MDNYYGNICYCRRCNGVVHTIKKGDTLYLISKYYKVPIGEIMGANRNINIYNLQIGDEICIPVRRPEPRENDVNDTMLNNMNRNLGSTMNNAGRDMENNMSDMMSDMTGVDVQSNMMTDNMSNYMNDNESDSVMDNVMDNREEETSATVQNISGLKVSELIGGDDMTVEELAKLLKKYM